MNIYVSNLSFDLNDEKLKEFFAPFGEVKSAKVITDRETGRSRGFGFVEMADQAAGNNAITQLNGKVVNDRTITVNEARPKTEKSRRDNWS